MVSNEQLHKLKVRISKLKTYLEIDKKIIEVSNEEEKTANPNFWNNPKEAELVMKNLRSKKTLRSLATIQSTISNPPAKNSCNPTL